MVYRLRCAYRTHKGFSRSKSHGHKKTMKLKLVIYLLIFPVFVYFFIFFDGVRTDQTTGMTYVESMKREFDKIKIPSNMDMPNKKISQSWQDTKASVSYILTSKSIENELPSIRKAMEDSGWSYLGGAGAIDPSLSFCKGHYISTVVWEKSDNKYYFTMYWNSWSEKRC